MLSVSSFHTSRNPISFVRSLIQQRIFSIQSPSSRSNLERSHYVHQLLNYLVESKTQVSHEDWTNHLIEDVVSFALSELKETAGLTNFPNEADSHFSSARRTLERIQASEEREIFSRFLSEQQDKIGTHPSQVEHIRQIEESVLRREGEVELEKERKELIAVEKHRLSVLTSELIQERDQLSEYIEEEFNFQEEERESRHLEEIDFCERWKLELEDRKRLREEQQRQDKKSDIQIDHDSSSGSHSFLRDLDSLIERATISSHSPVNKSPKESSKHLYKKNFITNMSDSMQPGSPKTSGTKRKLILLMTVEIGDGRVDTIRIHQGDRADDLASSFIRKHGLSDSVFPPLRNHIEAHMQQIQPDTGDTESIPQSKDRGKDSVSESALATSKQSRPGTSPSASSIRGTLRQNLPKQPNKASASEAPLSRKSSSSVNSARPSSARSPLQRPTSASRSRPSATSNDAPKQVRSSSLSRPRSASQQRSSVESPIPERFRPQIDPKSRKLAEKTCQAAPVHERLHQQASDRQKHIQEISEGELRRREEERDSTKVGINPVSKSLTKDRNSGNYGNYGERLYREGLQKRLDIEKRAEEERRSRESKDDPELTFRPQISDMARKLERRGPSWKRVVDANGENAREHKALLRMETEKKEISECTFHPDINPRSQRIANDRLSIAREHEVSHFDQLYLDAERRRERLEEMSSWIPEEVTFRPAVSERASYLSYEDEEEFIDRLVNSRKEYERAILSAKEADMHSFDPVTGQQLFKPKIGKSPIGMRHENVSEKLYSSSKIVEEAQRKQKEEEEFRAKELARMSHLSSKSKTIVENLRDRRLSEIFRVLDVHQLGSVNLSRVRYDHFNPQLASILRSILENVATLQTHMNESEFKDAVAKAWDSLKSGPHTCILRGDIVKSDERKKDEAYVPKINSTSAQLASHLRPSNQPYYESLLAESRKWEEKKDRLRKEKEATEVEECTFRPTLYSRSSSAGSRRGKRSPSPSPTAVNNST